MENNVRTIKDVWQLSDKELDEEWRDLTDYLIVENQDSELEKIDLLLFAPKSKDAGALLTNLRRSPAHDRHT